MVSDHIQWLFYLFISCTCTNAFVPGPIVASGGEITDSVTHTEITQIALTRSVARFLYDTRIRSNNNNNHQDTINEQDYFTKECTIDQFYQSAYPEYDQEQITQYSLPLKFILDYIIGNTFYVDFERDTAHLAAAHFEAEAFSNSSRRMLQFKQRILNDVRDPTKDLTIARALLGQLFHTLQDFYAHSNWVEMGKTDINELLGVNETIGRVAQPNQSTCTNNGCTRIEKPCSIWHRVTVGVCPLIYYDCQNNILPEINNQEILTSGYAENDRDDNNEVIDKPTNVEKCSHGSVFDATSHIPAIGGMNKDSTSLVYSPHANLHHQAVRLAVKATEHIGDDNFNRFFVIHPSAKEVQGAANHLANGRQFQYFVPLLATSVEEAPNRFMNFITSTTRRLSKFFSFNVNLPTHKVNRKELDRGDMDVAPIVVEQVANRRKKRFIDALRKRE